MHTVPVDVPGNATGPLTLLVPTAAGSRRSSSARLRQASSAERRADGARLQQGAANNRLYVRLISADPGAVVSGEPLAALPPSVLAVLEADRNGGTFARCRARRSASGTIPTEYAISGAKALSLSLRRQLSRRRLDASPAILHHARTFRPLAAVVYPRSASLRSLHGAGARLLGGRRRSSRFPEGRSRPACPSTCTAGSSLGPALTELSDTASPVALDDGIAGATATSILGTGNDGHVSAGSTRDGTSRVFFDCNELEVHALAPRAGRRPLRRRRRPTAASTRWTAPARAPTFFDPDEIHLGARGRAGRRGVRRHRRQGTRSTASRPTARVASSTRRNRRTCDRSCSTASGELLAGTDRPAASSVSARTAAAFLVLDRQPPGNQRACAPAPAASSTRRRRPASRRTTRPSESADHDRLRRGSRRCRRSRRRSRPSRLSTTRLVRIRQPVPRVGTRQRQGRRVSHSAPDGVWDQVWSSRDDAPYDVALDGQGGLLVATGGKGKIYRRHRRADGKHAADARSRAAGHRAHRRRRARPAHHDGESRARSSGSRPTPRQAGIVRVGRPRRRGRRHLGRDQLARGDAAGHATSELFTRTRQHRRAGRHLEPLVVAPTAGRRASRSPARRRATCSGRSSSAGAGNRSPVVTSVTVAFQQRNLRPRDHVDHRSPARRRVSAAVLDRRSRDCGLRRQHDRAARAGGTTGGGAGTRPPRLSERTADLCLEGAGPNDDDLTYDILYRREGETSWKALKRNLTDPILVWDTTSVPNGTYVDQGRGVRRVREPARRRAGRRAGERHVRHRQRAADDYGQLAVARGGPDHRAVSS